MRRVRAALLAASVAACTLPPLRGRIEVGKDPYGVFVADGSGGADLQVFHGTTGQVVPLTFSPVAERAPALAPDGSAVVFLRGAASVWVINLLSGAERELALPRGAPPAERAAWGGDASAIYVEGGGRVWRFTVPPGPAPVEVPPADRARADSAFLVLLGSPAFARAEPCDSALCVISAGGERTTLAPRAAYPARWGADSVAWVADGAIHVRPLGGGAPRVVELDPARTVQGAISYFAGRR